MLTVGLVVEGTHDVIMLVPFIKQELAKVTDETVSFRPLQPAPDESGALGDGGWFRVVAWCKDNSGSAVETFFTPLFAGDVACDLIVVHLDGDALELMPSHTNVVVPNPIPSIEVRIALLTQALEGWLAISPVHRSKTAFALPVLQSEAWVLAAEGHPDDVEKLDAKAEFRKAHPLKRGGLAGLYRARVDAIADHAGVGRCVSYGAFSTEIQNLTI